MERNKIKKRPAKELTFQEKNNLIKKSKETGWSQRKLAETFKISKSQVQRILSNQEQITKSLKSLTFNKRRRVNRMYI